MATAGDIDSAVAIALERESKDSGEPLMFVAPALRSLFVEAAAAARVDRERAKTLDIPGFQPLALTTIWNVTIDLGPRDEWYEGLDDAEPGAPWEELAPKELVQIKAGLGNLPQLTGEELDALATWVADRGLELLGDDRPAAMTVGGIIARAARDDVEERVYPVATQRTRGWAILTQDPGRSRYLASHGLFFAPYKEYAQALRELNGYEISVGVERLVKWMTEQHDDDSPSCRAVPTVTEVQKHLDKEGIRYRRSGEPRVARSAARLLMDPRALEPPPSVLPYLAWRGRFTVFAAREKQGKSTLVGSAVAALTQGAPWLGLPTVPGNVLWLHEESEGDVIARLTRFGGDLERVFLLHLPLASEADLKANVAAHAPMLIVIDSLMRYATSVTQDTSASQWREELSPLLDLAHKRGIAILALHHATKRDGEYRDSTEIGAAADMLIQMPGGLKDGRQRLEARGRIVGIDPFDVTIELSNGTHRLLEGGGGHLPSGLAQNERKALSALRVLVPDAGAPAATIPAWEQESGLPRTTFDRAREALVAGGQVVREGQRGARGQRFRPRVAVAVGPTRTAQTLVGPVLVGHD